MFKPLSVFIGLRYTRARRRERFISFMSLSSMIGLMLGVAVLITVLSVMNGFDRELRTRILALVPHATVRGAAGTIGAQQAATSPPDGYTITIGGMTIGSDEVEQLLGLRSGRPLRIVDLPARAEAISRASETPAPFSPFPLAAAQASSSPTNVVSLPVDPHAPIDLKVLVETMEQERIQMALEAADGVISEAARLLTLKRTTLIEKMRKYGVGRQAA